MNVKKENRILQIIQNNTIWLILLIMILLASFVSSDFRTFSNISNLLSQSSIVGILAIGQTIVLITGGFDLSMASMMSLAAVLIALFFPYGYFIALPCLLVLGARRTHHNRWYRL